MVKKRKPYLAQLRGFGGPDPWNTGRRFGGDDSLGCETRIATEQGAIIVRVQKIDGVETVKVHLTPHKDFRGSMQGVSLLLYKGLVDPRLKSKLPGF